MATELPELTVVDSADWRAWLAEHHDAVAGVWLVLAKKGTREPTRLTYQDALAEALCYGWIDGQLQRRDAATYRQRFTPRGARSAWSRGNVALVERLLAEGRMQPAGIAAVERATATGRWEAAYAGAATIAVPDDLAAALHADPQAQAAFDRLTRLNRYALLYRVGTARRPETRARRIMQFVATLAAGQTIHPQRRSLDDE
jgi:uncharacterized protein YdeI (YjbR/CyaY-like superfamily)